jgi:hypothetical protein
MLPIIFPSGDQSYIAWVKYFTADMIVKNGIDQEQ